MASIVKVDTIQEKTTGNGVVFSNPVELANGTATAPSLAFASDTNSGLYRISEDKIGVAVNGARVGEVGVGYGGFTGNIIQILDFSTDYNQTISSSTSYTDIKNSASTTWEVSITPKVSNSKILIMFNVQFLINTGSAIYSGIGLSRKIGAGAYSQIFAPATNATSGSLDFGSYASTGGNLEYFSRANYLIMDTPNTSSTLTYKLQGRCYTGNNLIINYSGTETKAKSFIYLLEISA